jgi:HlyD family secretion protein
VRQRLILLGSGLALAAAAFVIFRPRPIPVDVAAAARGPLQATIDEEGETRVRDRFLIAAPVAGRLERIALDEGDAVQAGAVLARMHPLPLDRRAYAEGSARLEAAEAQKREADARVAQARAGLKQARRAAERARRLAAAGTISAEELDLAELTEATREKELEAALFAADAADHTVQAARAALLAPGSDDTVAVCGESQEPCIEIRSPVSGRVLRVREESERVVTVGAPLLEVGDPGRIEVVVDVLSTDAVKVQPGAAVLIEDWGGEQPLHARVRLVEPSGFTKVSALGVEEQRVNVLADLLDAPASLADGYRVEARIVVWESPEVLKIPASTLFRHGGQWSVFVVEAGRARRRAIEAGHRNAAEVEVLAGLNGGEPVVLHPSDLVADGARVSATAGGH